MHAIVIWFDNLPYGAPGCCGNTQAHTPGFDRFAAGSVTFDNCLVDVRRQGSDRGFADALGRLHLKRVTVRVLGSVPTHLGKQLARRQDIMPRVEMLEDDDEVLERLMSAVAEASTAAASANEDASRSVTVVSLPSVVTPQGDVINDRFESADRIVGRLAELHADERTLLLVTAGEGHLLAEDGRELQERMIHVPLLARVGGPLEFGVHSSSLVARSDVPLAVMCWMGLPVEDESGGANHAKELLQELSGERAVSRRQVLLYGPGGTVGVRTSEWYLQSQMDPEQGGDRLSRLIERAALFVKPDDLWDSLDVATQSPGVVEELIGRLPGVGGKTGDGPEKHR